MLIPYDRDRAVQYAHTWAFQRNPQYYSYDLLGGDCTNFASQCLYAGSGIMNHTPTFGWYYYSGDNKAPAWTGVSYLFQFLTRKQQTPGPAAQVVGPDELRPGPGVTQTKMLSDYFPDIAGTNADSTVYVMEGEQPVCALPKAPRGTCLWWLR